MANNLPYQRVQLCLTPPLMAALREAAGARGIGCASFLRYLLIDCLAKTTGFAKDAKGTESYVAPSQGKSDELGTGLSKKSRAAK